MLELVTASRFDRRMHVGRTAPCLLDVLYPDGNTAEVIAKFSAGCDRGVDALVAEAIAAMLAADLELPSPEPLLVQFDADFVGAMRLVDAEAADRAARSVPLAFGSRKLPPGFSLLPRDKAVQVSLHAEAAEIFAFDALIDNPDRIPRNPNCQTDGRSFAIFDHELAFSGRLTIGWRPPWQAGALEPLKGPVRHLFYDHLQGRNLDMERLRGAWRAISDTRLREYRQALPAEWTERPGFADEALGHIASVRENIDAALAEVQRVLK